MFGNTGISVLALALVVVPSEPRSALAITADVARTCNALVAKSFPPREPGNPAAGSSKGDASEQREFFQKCVANGGKMDDEPSESDEARKPPAK